MSASTSANEPAWPADLLDAAEAADWIAAVLPGRPAVAGPIEIYRSKEWGVTARFAVGTTRHNSSRPAGGDPRQPDGVVFKASSLPLFSSSPAVYELLTPRFPDCAPELLAWDRRGEQTWTLFRPFAGRKLSEVRSLEGLVELARTVARIQAGIARLPHGETARLPYLSVQTLPVLFEALLRDIRDRHLALWRADGWLAARGIALPDDPRGALARFQQRVEAWSAELKAGGWPDAIDHVDLHTDNAVLQDDGRVLIYDWEEAIVGCPFFSLDRLLADAREYATGADGVGAARAVRDAYLDALPWQTRERRGRALDLALRLAPIKTAYEGEIFAEARGWADGHPRLTAWCMARALQRWGALEAKQPGG